MCYRCFVEFGAPVHTSPQIEEAAQLIDFICAENPSARPLHTSIDDWNIEVEWKPWPDHQELVSPECWEVAVKLSALMNSMSIPDRAAALGQACGYNQF